MTQQTRLLTLVAACMTLGIGCGGPLEDGDDDLASYAFGDEPAVADSSAVDETGWVESELGSAAQSRADKAIAWFKKRKGDTNFNGACELAVEKSYGTKGVYDYALQNWQAQVRKRKAHRNKNAPKGALVFWRTSGYGHVAVADGKGYCWSTSVNGRIGRAKLSYFDNYLGWAPVPSSF